MEHFSGQQLESLEGEDNRPKTVERLSNWVMGMQAELGPKGSPEKSPDNDNRKELDFEKTKEAPKLPDVVLKGSMMAVGEVLADKVSEPPGQMLVGAAGVKAAKQRSLRDQERRAAGAPPQSRQQTGLTVRQAVQLGILVGVCIGLLVLVWLAVR